MKKYKLCILLAAVLAVTACHKKAPVEQAAQAPAAVEQPASVASSSQQTASAPAAVEQPAKMEQSGPVAFDVSVIPVTNKDVGAFPFFTAPAGYQYHEQNEHIKTFDRSYYATGNKTMTAVEGKTLKVDIRKDKETNFEPLLIEKSYEKAITDVGGVKVFSGNASDALAAVESSEWQRYAGNLNIRSSGYSTQTYVIRTATAEIWVSIVIDNYNAYLTLTQKGELQQSVTQVKEGESSPESK